WRGVELKNRWGQPRTGSNPVSGTSVLMRNSALSFGGRGFCFWGRLSSRLSSRPLLPPQLLREPSNSPCLGLIQRMGVDRRGDRRRAMTQDLRDGHQRYTVGEHQCCRSMPEVVKADLRQLQTLERALEVLHQV